MDKDLSFLSHIKKLENKLSKSIGILNKVEPSQNHSTSIVALHFPFLSSIRHHYMGLNF